MSREALVQAAKPILEVLAKLDLGAAEATEQLAAQLPFDGEAVQAFGEVLKAGVADGSLVPRGEPPVRFGRAAKPTEETGAFSIDVVDMTAPGPGHTHPTGEVDLSFALEGSPTFDGTPPGWLVKAPGSWHIPTVEGGRMAIAYFLPKGAIEFGPSPKETPETP